MMNKQKFLDFAYNIGDLAFGEINDWSPRWRSFYADWWWVLVIPRLVFSIVFFVLALVFVVTCSPLLAVVSARKHRDKIRDGNLP
jgi:hypothetical protein